MKIKCELDQVKTLKKGMKITLAVPDEHVRETMKHIYNFMDMPLQVEVLTDIDKQKERFLQISPDQRKKIYALFNDIANYSGDSKDNVKHNMKTMFSENSQVEGFSLSNCSKDIAGEFIEWLIGFAFENGIGLSEHPKDYFDDSNKYYALSLKHKVCVVCGMPGTIVKTVKGTRFCICNAHHNETEIKGWENFAKRYHFE